MFFQDKVISLYIVRVDGQVLVSTAEDADEAYTYQWTLNPAEVTKLLYV